MVDDDEERYPFPIGVDCCFVFMAVCFTICSCCLQGMLVDDVDEERYPSPSGLIIVLFSWLFVSRSVRAVCNVCWSTMLMKKGILSHRG